MRGTRLIKVLLGIGVTFLSFDAPAKGPYFDKAKKSQEKKEVEQLKIQIQELTQRIYKLKFPQTTRCPCSENMDVKSKGAFRVQLKGQVNRGFLFHDNGTASNLVHVDNDNSSSRLAIIGEGEWEKGTTIGGMIEVDAKSNATGSVDVHNVPGTSLLQRRIIDAYIKDSKRGELFLGYGPMASDGTMENTDLSKTSVISDGITGPSNMAGGTAFFNKTAQNKASITRTEASNLSNANLTVATIFDSGDGLSRQNRVRYNSPAFHGLTLHTSHTYINKNDAWDVAVKYAGSYQQVKLAAQVAYVHHLAYSILSTSAKYHQVNGSLGLLFPIGISLMVGNVQRYWKRSGVGQGAVYFGKIGYQRQFFEAGITAFAVESGWYHRMIYDPINDSTVRQGYKGNTYGISLVQFLDRVATEVYVGARLYRLKGPDSAAPRYKNIKAVMTGVRVKF